MCRVVVVFSVEVEHPLKSYAVHQSWLSVSLGTLDATSTVRAHGQSYHLREGSIALFDDCLKICRIVAGSTMIYVDFLLSRRVRSRHARGGRSAEREPWHDRACSANIMAEIARVSLCNSSRHITFSSSSRRQNHTCHFSPSSTVACVALE